MKKICTALIFLFSLSFASTWSIFTGYNSGNEIRSKYSGYDEFLDKTTGSLVSGIEYQSQIQATKYAIGLQYSSERTISELVYNGVTIPYGTPNKISFASIYGNVYIPTRHNLSLIIGINKPVFVRYLMSTGTSFDLNALNIGYQAGIEYSFTKDLSVQGLFVVNNFTREIAGTGKTKYYSITGIEIKGKYTF